MYNAKGGWLKIKDCCLKRFVILNLIAKHRSNSKKPCRHHFRKQQEIISNTGTCREWLWWLWLKFAKLEVCFSSTQVDIPNCRTHKRPVHLKFAFRRGCSCRDNYCGWTFFLWTKQVDEAKEQHTWKFIPAPPLDCTRPYRTTGTLLLQREGRSLDVMLRRLFALCWKWNLAARACSAEAFDRTRQSWPFYAAQPPQIAVSAITNTVRNRRSRRAKRVANPNRLRLWQRTDNIPCTCQSVQVDTCWWAMFRVDSPSFRFILHVSQSI